jgi:hypothetical protein
VAPIYNLRLSSQLCHFADIIYYWFIFMPTALLYAGEIDVRDPFSLSMEVFPSTLNHNGILFSLGTRPNFEYYEWKTAAVNTQFIVIEFIFSAVSSRE